jgi:hypothetical protein
MVTPRYKSEARVLIETRDNIFLRPDAERTTERGAAVDQEAVTSQVQLILSRDLAREVIKSLKLAERPEFDPVLRGSSTIGVVLGLVGLIKDPMSQTPEERAADRLPGREIARHCDRVRVGKPGACGARRQCGRGHLSGVPADRQAGPVARGRTLAGGEDRALARRGRRCGRES